MSVHQTQQRKMKRREGDDEKKTSIEVGSILCLGLTDPSHSVPEMHVNPSVLFIRNSSSSVISFCNNRNGMLEPIISSGGEAEEEEPNNNGGLKFYKIQTAYSDTPLLEICNGVICTGVHDKVSLLPRIRPGKGVGDCLYVRPSNVQNLIVNIPPRRAHVPKAGDIVLVSCMTMDLCKGGGGNRSYHDTPQPLKISGGFQAVIFLPKIHDMPEFQRSVLDNAVLLRELGHSISAMVGCFTILRDRVTRTDVVGWDDERISEFIVKEYPALEALYGEEEEEGSDDHHEEEDDDDSTTTMIAARLRSSSGGCSSSGGDHKKKKTKH